MALDDLQAYGVAPYDAGNVQPYDRNAEIANQANNYLAAYAPTFPSVVAPAGATPTGTQQRTGPTEWEQQLQQAIQAKGDAFTQEDFDRVKEGFKVNLTPRLFAAKLSQAGVDAELAKFDAKAEGYRSKLFGAAATATPTATNDSGPGQIRENIAALLGGVAQTVPGVMALADYGLRAIPGIDGRTAIGDAAAGISEGINRVVEQNTSAETLAQRAEIAAAIEKDPTLANVVAQYLGHGRNLATLASTGVGSLVAPAGLAKYLGRAGGLLEGASKVRQIGTVAAAAGLPQSGVQALDLERRIDETPLADLIADNPQLQTVVDASKMIGLDDAAIEKRIKDQVKGEALRTALPAYVAGNVGLAMIPGVGGAEAAIGRSIFGGAAPGIVRRVAQGAASEALQEGGAAELQTIGENYGLNRPLQEGAAANIVPSAIAGALVGGAVSVPGQRTPRAARAEGSLNDRLKRRSQRTAQTSQEAPQGATEQPATPAADTPPATGVGPFDGAPAMGAPASTFVGVQGAFDATLTQLGNRIKRNSKTITSPNEAIQRAQIMAQDIAGDAWPTLNIEQRLDLIERTVNAIAKTKAVEGLGDAITSYKTQILTPATPPVQETGEVNEADAAAAAAALETEPPVQTAPIETPPVETPPVEQPRDRLKKITNLKTLLQNEFGILPDQLANISAADLTTLYNNKKAEAAAAKAAQKAAADQAAKAPQRSKLKKVAAPPKTEDALLNNYLAYLADKPLLVDPQYLEVIQRDPRLADAKAAMAAGKITDTKTLKAFLGGAGAATAENTTTDDNRLVGAILGDKKLKKESTAKVEVRDHLNALKDVLTKDEVSKMTLAQLRKARKELTPLVTPVRGKVKKTAKEKPKETPPPKKATPNPKTQAPAKEATETGAQQNPAKEKAARKRVVKATAAEQIRQRFKELDAGTLDDLVTAVELGQQGETATLSETIREATTDGVLNKDDAKFLRKLAAQEYKPARQVLEEEVNEIIKEAEEGDPDEDLSITTPEQVARNTALHLEIEDESRNALAERMSETKSALASLEAALMSSDDVLTVLDMQQEPASGTQEIIERLAQLRANPGLREAADFGIWLLERNPQVAKVLNLTTANIRASGSYNPAEILVKINESDAAPRTVVHEILHHTERMMPVELQGKIRGEYAGRLINKLKQATKNGDEAAIAYLNDVITYQKLPLQYTRKRALDHILYSRVDADEYYKYLNPSEYWAETASEILARRYKNPDDWKAKLKEWYREFLARLKSVLKLDSDSAVYQGLNEVLNGTGDSKSTTQIRKGGSVGDLLDARPSNQDEDESNPEDDPYLKSEGESDAEFEEIKQQAKIVRADTDAGLFQHIWEGLVNNVQAFEEVLVNLNKAGGEVNVDNNPADNYRLYNGRVSHNNKVDRAQVVEPVIDWVDQNWAMYAHDKQSFIEALNRFFGNTNFLERIRTDWMLKVPLKNGMEVRRLDIMDGLNDGTLTPEAARRQLSALVASNAAMDMREHALSQGMSEKTFDAIQTKLDELFQAGIDKESMADLNAMLDGTRARIRERLVEAGYFPENDPYQEFYGWQWYVPLKGVAADASDIVSQNAFDMIPDDKLSLARLNKQIEAMEGRKTFGQRPFERLFVDLARAGERSANTEFMQSVYNLVTDNPKILGAKIRVFNGTPRLGYTSNEILDNEGNPKVHGSLPKPRRGAGFVFNDGDTHYVVDLPRNSQLLRGLILMNATARPNAFVKAWSVPTNILARGYTTLSPFWQTATGFVRDLTTLPTTIAVEQFDNPLQASRFFTRYGAEILQLYKAAPTFFKTLTDNVNGLEAMADANPDGYAAWLRRWEQGGGSNEYTKAFDLEGVNKLFRDTIKDADGVWDVTKAGYRAAIKYTGNYANFLEQMSRVAAFKALVESEGMSDKEAAIQVRKVLDYQQTGLWGRNINSFIAFYRVGATSVDTMRRIFRKPTGGLDTVKLAKWTLPIAGMGAMAYMMIGAMMGFDDDGKKRMHKMRPETLTQKMLIPFGDKVVGVNIGLGLPQLLLAPGILTAAVTDGHITIEEAISEMYATVLRNGPFRLAGYKDATPTNVVSATALGLTPTVLAPMMTLERNTDAFDRPIHTEFDNKNLPHSEQGRSSTPKEFTDIARTIYDWSGGLVDYYPEDIKYLVTNYGGQNVADLIKMTADVAAKNEVGIDAYYNPATSRFEVKDEDYYDQDRMYEVLDEAGESKRRLETIKRRALNDGLSESAANALGNRFLSTHPEEAAVIEAAKQLTKIRTQRSKVLRELSRDRMTSVGRKQIIRKEQDRKMREATDRVEQLLEQIE